MVKYVQCCTLSTNKEEANRLKALATKYTIRRHTLQTRLLHVIIQIP